MAEDEQRPKSSEVLPWAVTAACVYFGFFGFMLVDSFLLGSSFYYWLPEVVRDVFEKVYWPLIFVVRWLIGVF